MAWRPGLSRHHLWKGNDLRSRVSRIWATISSIFLFPAMLRSWGIGLRKFIPILRRMKNQLALQWAKSGLNFLIMLTPGSTVGCMWRVRERSSGPMRNCARQMRAVTGKANSTPASTLARVRKTKL